MIKFFLKVFAFAVVLVALEVSDTSFSPVKKIMVALAFSFVLPALYRRWKENSVEARWKRESEQRRIDKENAAEYEHQTALRRERERLEMHAEIRIKELIAMIETQHQADARKMQLLSQMKAEFANRQSADMASLLGRLEAMKASA